LSSGATGSSPDASGTTEALRLAQSLWLGSQVFGDRTDREQAVLIPKVIRDTLILDNGFWLIHNLKKLELCYQLIFSGL